ncbi:MAG TPA: ABC transporter substrate-binding protein [Candidatus Heimdallarchaeota archaeon]|nr:ABC transporter substrate-binding protein [Candidatus Heimdallarchaeota archaeon]
MKASAVIVVVVGLLGLVAWAQTYPVSVVDDRGMQITIAGRPERIISIGALYTEILIDLGAGDRLVAVADSPDNPQVVAGLASVGPSYAPNVEVILSLHPDLVLGATDWGGERPALEEAGVSVLSGPILTGLPDLFAAIRAVGTAVGLSDVAEALIGRIAEVSIGVESTALRPIRVRTAFLYAGSANAPPYAAGGGTIENELILRAGGQNVFADVDGFPQVSFEAIISRSPEVIFTDPSQIVNITGNPLLEGISAVTDGRVHGIKASHVTSTKVADVLQAMASLLHPQG